MPNAVHDSILTDDDLHLFNEGTHQRLYHKLGSRLRRLNGVDGAHFAVWAPGASEVSVIGEFNGWDPSGTPMRPRASSGIWEAFVPGAGAGDVYKYVLTNRAAKWRGEKADPFAFKHEAAPATASIVQPLEFEWRDAEWMRTRGQRHPHDKPMSIYEMHLGSWKRCASEGGRSLHYAELAETLPKYVEDLGFTHVEFMPVMEHPLFASWGYQTTGYFAPQSRLGTPQDLMYLIDRLHDRGIGVILDWVPSHFPIDDHGLARFDGTHLFEHSDPRQGFHPDWKSAIFNYGRHEVRAFLISSAMFWLDVFHADGLRVDAVASMLYLDYSRQDGEWIPNRYGGNENIEAIEFLRQLNSSVYASFPDVHMIAEESTAWPGVSQPTYVGGLGFGYKWDMGWMHDTLGYLGRDPVHRRFHHNELTFRAIYQDSENYIMPLSHDEVVHGKGSLLERMPGDDWQKLANLRLLLAQQWTMPGKKLVFMGAELGQWTEWRHDDQLHWELLDWDRHRGIHRLVRELNRVYRDRPALHERDCHPTDQGFQWVEGGDADNSVFSFLRFAHDRSDMALIVVNATPVVREGYRLGVPEGGVWREILNSDADEFGGSGVGNSGLAHAGSTPWHGRTHSLVLRLPPLGVLVLAPEGG